METLFTRDLPQQAPPVSKPLHFLLKYLKPSLNPPYSYEKVLKARVNDSKLTQGLLRKLIWGTLPPLAGVENREIPVSNGHIPIRIYSPQLPQILPKAHPLPILMYYHGGGFIFGNLDLYDSLIHYLATRLNVIVISVGYRLSPEFKFPVPFSDCWEATQWAVAHAGEIGGIANGLIVAGDSAGGMIAAEMCLKDLREGSSLISAQILLFPWLDGHFNYPSCVEFAAGYSLTTELMRYFAECYENSPEDWLDPHCCPMREDRFTSHCPTFLITGMYDVLRDQGYRYAERLRAAGVPVEYKNYCQCIHDMLVYHRVAPNGKVIMEDFLNSANLFLNSFKTR